VEGGRVHEIDLVVFLIPRVGTPYHMFCMQDGGGGRGGGDGGDRGGGQDGGGKSLLRKR
jgi:hypothetical protein